MIKPSEIRNLLSKDTDPKLLKVLLMLADELRGAESCITELAKLFDKMLDQMNRLSQTTQGIGAVLERVPEAKRVLDSLSKKGGDQGGDDGHGAH
jgi:hypothetical protein